MRLPIFAGIILSLSGCTINQYVNCLPSQQEMGARTMNIPQGSGSGSGTLSGTVRCPDGSGASASMSGEGSGSVSP